MRLPNSGASLMIIREALGQEVIGLTRMSPLYPSIFQGCPGRKNPGPPLLLAASLNPGADPCVLYLFLSILGLCLTGRVWN